MTTTMIMPGIRQVQPLTTRQIYEAARYKAAMELVARIDEDLTRGIRHYRTGSGQLLTTLDEVIRAILGEGCQVVEGVDYRAESYRKDKPPRRKKTPRADRKLPDDQTVADLNRELSLREIARRYGTSHQAVAQVIRRARAYQAGELT